MATLTFNADSAGVTASGMTKVGSTFVLDGSSGIVTIPADFGAGKAADHSTVTESLSGAPIPWTPDDITTEVWFDASDESTISDSGGVVTQWDDKSGNDNHAIPRNTGPITGTATQNGLNVVTFTNDPMDTLSNLGISGADERLMIAVFSTPTTSNNQDFLGFGNASPTNMFALLQQSSVFYYNRYAADISTGPLTANKYSIEAMVEDSGLEGFRFGVSQGTNATIANTTASKFSLGISPLGNNAQCNMAEVVLTTSFADRQKAEGYLAWKWGLVADLDPSHPYKSSPPLSGDFGQAPTATYQTTDDEPPTNFVPVTPESLTALRLRANTVFQTESIKVFLDGPAGSIWDGNTIDTYSPDVTPPADPTGGKQVAGDRWGMWWDQSPEGITTVSRLRRTIDGTNYYLANVAGLAEWVSTTPTTWWIFSRGLSTANSQSNSWEEANVVATTISYSTQHVDEAMNNSEWVGFVESGAGSAPVAPILNGLTVSDGTITINVTANSESDVVYGRVRRNSPAYSWEARNVGFSITGSGTISITGLINGIEYEVAAQTVIGGASGIGSDFAGSRFAAPDADAFATSRYNGKINRRNRTALAALQICQRLGVKIDFTNIQGSTSVNIYAMVDEAATSNIGVRTGDIDGSAVVLIVPRQTNFPPEKILPNSIITLNTKVYQIDRWSSDVEDINMASTWKLYCSVSGDCYGY